MLSFVELHCGWTFDWDEHSTASWWKYIRRPLRYVCSEPGSYSLPLFFSCLSYLNKKMLQNSKLRSFCCRNAVKCSSALYFSKYHDCKRRTEVQYSFSCFQRTCRLWKYLFLLYMWQSILVLLLSLLRLIWLNVCLPFSAPCSQGFCFLVVASERGFLCLSKNF